MCACPQRLRIRGSAVGAPFPPVTEGEKLLGNCFSGLARMRVERGVWRAGEKGLGIAGTGQPDRPVGGWPSWPSWQAGFQPAGKPPAPPARTAAFPPPSFSFQTRPDRPRRRRRISNLPPAAEEATPGGRGTKAGRTGGMVCGDVKQRPDNFSDTSSWLCSAEAVLPRHQAGFRGKRVHVMGRFRPRPP